MSPSCITIGGAAVSLSPHSSLGEMQRAIDNRLGSDSLGSPLHTGHEHVPVALTVAPFPGGVSCPLPPGPVRIASTLALLGLLIALAALVARPHHRGGI